MFSRGPAITDFGRGKRRGLIAALDVGSAKIACVIGESDSKGLRVVGAALRESRGVRHGTIVDLDLAEQAIRGTVAHAEAQADARIRDVIISVNCARPTLLTSTASLAAGGDLIADKHLRSAIQEASTSLGLDGHSVIQRAVTSYAVDDVRNIARPLGMHGERLEITVAGLALRTPPLANLVLATERAGLSVSGALFASAASALAVLTEDEMQLGSVVLDMGAGVTSIAVVRGERLAHADLVPLGGELVTTDIANVLGTSISTAERIKCLHGDAISGGTDAQVVNVPELGDSEIRGTLVSRALVAQIIQARLGEIFGLVHQTLQKLESGALAGADIVLTGGACQLPRTSELAAEVLKTRVRVGRPVSIAGLSDRGPEYAAAVGLLLAGTYWPPETLAIPGLSDDAMPMQTKSNTGLVSQLLGLLIRKPDR